MQDQELFTIDAMGQPWKKVRSCNICGSASEGSTFEEALANFRKGKFTMQKQFPHTIR